jgi:glucans biosynthesis protein
VRRPDLEGSGRHLCAVVHEELRPPVPSRRSDPGGWLNFEINPMDHSQATRLQNLRQAPRCGAKTRGGTPCQRPAIRGRKRCRLHGGLSPGAPRGEKNGNYKTGEWTLEAIEERKWLRSLLQSFCKGTK